MSNGEGPRLKSVPGGLAKGDSPRHLKAVEKVPTTKLPAPPPLPPIPSTGENASPPAPPRPGGLPSSLSTTAEFAAIHPMVKKQFGRYQLLMQMGSGGMATLYLARIMGPQKFEKLLAVKKIHDHLLAETDFVAMFRDEARIAALIHHPNVVATFDLGVIDGAYFIAMEYVHGQTVKDIMNSSARRKDPVHWSHAIRIASEVAKGLHAAHTLLSHTGEVLNVIHRDVSPQNILVSYDGHVKLVDFGIAYAAERLTTTDAGKLKGKIGYMSPEQVSGHSVDHRSDIFSLATVLFETLASRRLFKEANEASTILKVRAARIPNLQNLNPHCPPELNDIIHKALARDPNDRYDTAEAFAEAIDELLVATRTRVGRKELAGMMEDLFFERKRIKDRMRRRALTNNTDTPLQGIEAIDDGTSSVVMEQMSTNTVDGIALKGGNGLLISAMAGGLLVLVILVGFLLLKPNNSKPKGTTQTPRSDNPSVAMTAPRQVERPRPQPMPPRRAAANSVMLTFRVSPKRAKATITFRSEVQHGSIFQAALPTSASREEVTVTAPGFERRVIPIVLSQALTLPVDLEIDAIGRRKRRKRRKRKESMRPRRRPMAMLVDL